VHHDIALISTMAISLVYALVGGYIASRLRLPPLVGYLIAGIVVGPFTPGFVADRKLAPQFANLFLVLPSVSTEFRTTSVARDNGP